MTITSVYEFINKHNLAVLSTVSSKGRPQAAVVEFGTMEGFLIIIDTFKTSRKYKNIKQSPYVSLVIGWDKKITVQLEGKARELSGEELKKSKEAYFSKNPEAKKWESKPDIVYLGIKPRWIRYSDLRQEPWLVQEFNL